MKLLHLGDLHLGKSLGEFDLIDDQKFILDQIIEIADTQKVDAVLVAGDVYDRAIPSEAATNLMDYFISQLAKREINTLIVSGNHDSDERLNYGSRLFEANNIYISAKFNGELYKTTLEDDYGEIDFYLLPFVKASQVRHFFPEDKIENYDDAVKAIIAHANIDTSRRNVLVGHQFVIGVGDDPDLGGSEGLAVQSVGLVEKINYTCFDDFDYVALGHIHSPQRIGRDTVRYSGSPLKYSLKEANKDKSVPIINMGAKGTVEMDFVPLKPMRDLRHIKGELKELLARENILYPGDFIYVTLTDEDIVENAMGIFQQEYPYTVKIDYDNSHTREIEHVDISNIGKNKPYEEIISDFYRLVYACEINDEELEMMKTVAVEVGVLNEAD